MRIGRRHSLDQGVLTVRQGHFHIRALSRPLGDEGDRHVGILGQRSGRGRIGAIGERRLGVARSNRLER